MKQDSVNRSCLCSILIATALICGACFIGNAYIDEQFKEKLLRWEITDKMLNVTDKMHNVTNEIQKIDDKMQNATSRTCENLNKPLGSEALPQGIIVKTSNLETQHLWNYRPIKKGDPNRAMSLLAMAVGIKQKELVNKVIQKFPPRDFVVMLFHYDGVVDEWKQYPWNEHAIHVSVMNQTKWWFAKRFLHPDIVVEYEYIFLWDEDLGVAHFNSQRYLSIVKEEGLEISQPALDTTKTKVHYPITARRKKSKFHRRMYKNHGSGRCDDHSTDPPCTGWVEIMAPVFSRSAWRCSWYMIQNDLIHAWGLDKQLGYCAQGDRKKNVGVVDAEYIVHYGLTTLGVVETASSSSGNETKPKSRVSQDSSESREVDNRPKVRMKSQVEMKRFNERWKKAVEDDRCWVDPY
ncbi:Lysine ketoglutarate reductase trans-splicing-like protein [Hirschfeldia incana]|nr:Lysine ketoglutarate reductase trans-splicing-like protein [Hirschfeldia incana]